MRLIALVLILIAPNWVVAQKMDEKAKLSDISPLYIELVDNATNGCWTNLMEAKSYAAGQIDIAGGKVVETAQEASSVFTINVHAGRMNEVQCLGSVQVSIYRPYRYDGVITLALYSQHLRTAVQPNFNNFALDVIKEAVQKWKE